MPEDDGQLHLREGMMINNIEGNTNEQGWWIGTDPEGNRGYIPSNYVELITKSKQKVRERW